MNLLLSNKIRLTDRHRFFCEAADQPCWSVDFERAEKRRQCKWKLSVKYLGEKEEHRVSLTSFDLENEAVWSQLTSLQFATDLLELFRLKGIKATKEWLKDESA